jgi:hypothetical protein
MLDATAGHRVKRRGRENLDGITAEWDFCLVLPSAHQIVRTPSVRSEDSLLRYRSMQLFVAKDREGIHASGAECGNQAGPERDQDKQHGYSEESNEVTGTHSVDQAGGHPAEGEGRNESDADARQRGFHSLNDDQAPDVAQRSSKSNAQTDFPHTAFHRIGKYVVDADGAEDESQQTEDREQLS